MFVRPSLVSTRSKNLVAPSAWQPITNVTADGGGLFEFIAFDSVNYSNRFFRAIHLYVV